MGQPKLTKIDEFDSVFGDELEPGQTLMHGQYTIEEFLNAGGFGITYLAKDSLERTVVIKECFPGSLCRRTTSSVQARSRAHTTELSSIVRLFVEEARSLARLDHPNIVGVHQVFEENNTAYMALDYVEGRDLLDIIENPEDAPKPEQVEMMLRKLLDAVGFIHDQGILHRDISPDNVLIQPNMEPILIDFGAAREEAGKKSRILSAMRVVKDGYSPQEFYISGAEQGQFSDLYALGATFYHLITGELPANSQSRLAAVASGSDDIYVPVVNRVAGYSDAFLKGIDKALEILPKDRIASASYWLSLLDGETSGETPAGSSTQAPAKAGSTAKPSARRSSAALLLGTAAVIVPILAGIAYTQSGNSAQASDPAAIAVATQEAAATSTESGPVETAQVDPVASGDADILVMLTEPVAPAASDTSAVSAEDSLATLLAAPTGLAGAESPAVSTDATADVVIPQADTSDVVVAALPAEPQPKTQAVVSTEPVEQTPWVGWTDQPSLKPEPVQTAIETPVLPIVEAPVPQVIEAFDLPQVISKWSVDVTPILQNSTDTIFEINGLPVKTPSDIETVMSENLTAPKAGEAEVIVLVGPDKSTATYQTLTVPVVHNTTFLNGMWVETRMIDGAWTTNVVSAPSDLGFQAGDVLVGDMATGSVFDARTSLPDLLVGAHADNRSKLTLAVRRGAQVVPVDVPLPSKS